MGFDTAIARVQRKFLGRLLNTAPDVKQQQKLTVPPICRREIVPFDMLQVENTKDTTHQMHDTNTVEEIRARRRARRKELADATATHIPRLSRRSRVIAGGESLRHVMEALPSRHRGCDAQCVYSTADDGVSLGTLYERVAGSGPVLLLVRDTNGWVSGAFSSCGYRPESGAYTGNGEAFVFRVTPKPQVWGWRRTNKFFQLCTPESIAVGGGGAFALFLDENLLRGASGVSETFGNEVLASETQFEVVVVEAYKLVVPARLEV